ncbi:MAG: DNA methyltransferase, partial [Chloroflexi bacterium]
MEDAERIRVAIQRDLRYYEMTLRFCTSGMMMTDSQHIAAYLDRVQHEFKTGIAAEHAYRPALEELLETAEAGINAVNDPKRTDIGAPDFIVLRGEVPLGIAEAKDIGIDLNRTERSDQMKRYLTYPNLILTDYLEFRWYVGGEHRDTVRIADTRDKRLVPDADRFADLAHLLHGFAQTKTPTVYSAQELAQRMAGLAREICYLIENDLNSDDPSEQLVAQMSAFQRTLLPDLDNRQFADMYAQTIVYGLFASRINYKGDPTTFTRRGAAEDIPRTNPFLRRLFSSIGLDLGERITWLVDNVADLLAHADTDSILEGFGRRTRQEDPVVHFYETFLREYDPRLREQRGVYYTPEPVVSYIVRSVDHILKTKFGRFDGLADPNTLVLDPATGTGTFLYFVVQHIYEQIVEVGGQRGAWSSYVRDHLLPRLFGFELLMAPYAIAHVKLGLQLQETGYEFDSDQRLGIYLTNTLEEAQKSEETMFAQFISHEANEAAAIKRD